MSLLSFCREFLKQCRYNVQSVFGLQDYAEDYAVLASCKHLDQTCIEWGRKKKTVSSACYLSGYQPTQSYLIQPHPTLDSSTSLPCSTPSNHLVSCHPTQWNHILPGPTLEPPASLPCSPLSYPILHSPTSVLRGRKR